MTAGILPLLPLNGNTRLRLTETAGTWARSVGPVASVAPSFRQPSPEPTYSHSGEMQ